MNKLILCLAPLLVATTPSWAATFSAGGGAGTSIVDAAGTGDYTSLAAAAADFTSYPGGSTGNWNLLIRSDLTETTTSLFGNNTNGHAVTVRPATGTSVTVSFMISERPAGWTYIWDGNIVVGPSKLAGNSESLLLSDSMRYMETDNFIIDGCNTPGGTERNLTLLTPESANVGAAINRFCVRVVGSADNSIIRNTTIQSDVLGSGSSGYCCVVYNSRHVSEGSLLYIPNNGKVENCGLYATKGSTGRGVYSQDTGSFPGGIEAIRGLTITKNDISATYRPIQFASNAGGEISYNKVKCLPQDGSNRPELIIHTGSSGVPFAWTTDIMGNQIDAVVTPATNGFNYIILVGNVPAANSGAVFNIRNNLIGGVNGTATITAAGSLLGRMIAFEGINGTYNIQHNSISTADIPNYGATIQDTSNRMSCLSFLAANGFAGTINFENNIISYRQHNASIIACSPGHTVGGNLNFNNNTYHLGAGAKFAEINSTTYNTLAEWQASGRDLASVVADPFTQASGGVWKSDADPHFTADPVAAFKTNAVIAGITTDIDQNPRPAVTVTKGADEYVPPPAGVSSWSLY